MELVELLEEMDRTEKAQADFGTPEPYTIVLTTPRKAEPSGEYVRLFGRSGPKGLFLTARRAARGGVNVTARYKIAEVRAYIQKELGE